MNIESIIENYILNELVYGRKNQISPNESLINTGILDSLTLLQLISFIEDQFSVTVEDEDMTPDNFHTINSMSSLIKRKLGEN